MLSPQEMEGMGLSNKESHFTSVGLQLVQVWTQREKPWVLVHKDFWLSEGNPFMTTLFGQRSA